MFSNTVNSFLPLPRGKEGQPPSLPLGHMARWGWGIRFNFFPCVLWVSCFVSSTFFFTFIPGIHFSHWQKKRELTKPFPFRGNAHSRAFPPETCVQNWCILSGRDDGNKSEISGYCLFPVHLLMWVSPDTHNLVTHKYLSLHNVIKIRSLVWGLNQFISGQYVPSISWTITVLSQGLQKNIVKF